MAVSRLSEKALKKIIAGKTNVPATCVVKFYSNTCPMCHNLKEYYEDISEDKKYSDLYFFAFNLDDGHKIEQLLNFEGTPTIVLMRTTSTPQKPKIRIMQDPEEPNEKTWYKTKDICKFIDKEK